MGYLEQNLGGLIVDHSKQWTGLQSSDLNSGLVLQLCGVNIRLLLQLVVT